MEAVVVSGVSGLASRNNPHSGFRLAWGRTKRASIMIPKNIIPLFSDLLKGIVCKGFYSLERGERSLVGIVSRRSFTTFEKCYFVFVIMIRLLLMSLNVLCICLKFGVDCKALLGLNLFSPVIMAIAFANKGSFSAPSVEAGGKSWSSTS